MSIGKLPLNSPAINNNIPVNKSKLYGRSLNLNMSGLIAANEKVFAMAGYSLNVQPEQMPYWKYFVEDNICSLIINIKPELKMSKDSSPIAPTSSPAIANTHVRRSTFEIVVLGGL